MHAESTSVSPRGAVLAGAAYLLAGLLVALFLAGAVATGLGRVAGDSGAAAFLPLLAVPVFALTASGWVMTVVYRLGVLTRLPRLGLASYALLALPVALSWLLPNGMGRGMTLTFVAAAVPAFLAARSARLRLETIAREAAARLEA